MLKEELDHFRRILDRQGREIERTIERMKENKDAEQDKYSPTELSNYDNHPAELGTQLFEVELNSALKVHEEHLFKEIHDALGRIDEGVFGKCAFCGREIPKERLEAIPYTRLCIGCEENKAVTPQMLRKIRPNEEKVLDAPMG